MTLMRSLRAVLLLAALAVIPATAFAQVNTGKVGETAGDTIKGAAEGGTQTSGEAQKQEGEAAQPAAPAETGQPVLGALDEYPVAPTDAEKKAATNALMKAALDFMHKALEVKPDVRTMTFSGRAPWVSRAPRPNPFDPLIEKPLPFTDLGLKSLAPPAPYYPPNNGIQRENQAQEFQQFLDSARLAGVVTIGSDNERQAIVIFGRTTVRLKVGQEVEQKNYTIKVVDITDSTVRVSASKGELQGILTMDASSSLFSGQGERGLVIISESATSNSSPQ
ncbi:MAG TPA: hypothetical protein VEI97_01940 [bacterium]|nr:hypothetical protein [bacterium]